MARTKFTFGHQVVLEGLFVLSYAVDRRYRNYVLGALLAGVVYAGFFMSRLGMTPLPLGDMAFGMRGFSLLLYTSSDLLIRDAQKEYRRVGDKRDIPSLPFRSRLWWAFQLAYNPRAINWTNEVSGLPPKPQEKTRFEFIRGTFLRACFWIVMDEANKWVLRRNPYFTPNPDIQGWQWLWRMYSCGYAFNVMTELTLHYCWVMSLVVLLGFTRPSDWPMPCGSLSHTYSLATFWGKTWHSVYKKPFVIYAKFVNNLLGLKKNSAAASALGLLTAFFLSGVMHSIADYAMFEDWTRSTGALPFFLLQVPGLLFEQSVMGLMKRMGVQARWWTYAVGYIWVYTWCALTMPYWTDPHIRSGYWGMAPKYGIFLHNVFQLRGAVA